MNWQNKRVLITGAAGFIGSHLVKRLLNEGAQLSVLFPAEINPWRLHNCLPHVRVIDVDLRNRSLLQQALSAITPHIVFHLASVVDVTRSWDLLAVMVENNVLGTLNLLSALKDSGIEMFLNFGSSEEYGPAMSPLSEELREMPLSPYSFSKTAAVFLCQMATRIFDYPVINARLFPTYGPGQDRAMFIPSAISELLCKGSFTMSHGEQLREFNYVDDVVEAILLVSQCGKLMGDIVNIGNGNPVQIKTVMKIIEAHINGDTKVSLGGRPLRKGERESSWCDNRKLKELTGWTNKVSLEEGLRRTVEWYKNNAPVLFDKKKSG
ncbi:MAG: GDP-mannose 4,6-dehydratase [Pseudomonadota bacterium]